MLAEVITKRTSKRVNSVNVVHVARLAGVSNATVSRVFSETANVNHDTRKKVIDAAEKLNYTPNPLARGLRGSDTNTIGIIWSHTADPTASVMLHSLSAKFAEKGYVSYISDKFTATESNYNVLSDYINRRVDGLIYQADAMAGSLADKAAYFKQFKAAVIVSQDELNNEFDQVVLDRLEAYRGAARHFAKTGRRNISFAGCYQLNKNKCDAFRDELLNSAIRMPKDNIISLDNWTTEYAIELNSLLEQRFADKFPFDAVMCTTDIIAQVLMYWLAKKGYKVPDDVAVIGFDDTPICKVIEPSLASVDRRTDDVIGCINRMLFRRLANPEIELQVEKITMELVLRESAG